MPVWTDASRLSGARRLAARIITAGGNSTCRTRFQACLLACSASEARADEKAVAAIWKGPFVAEHVYDAVDAKIQPLKGGSAQRVHMNRLKPCYRSPVASLDDDSEGTPSLNPKATKGKAISK